MKVLFLARQLPAPADNGERIRTAALLTELARRVSVHLVAFEELPGAPRRGVATRATEGIPGLAGVTAVVRPSRSKRAAQIRALVGSRSYSMQMHVSSSFVDQARRVAAAFRPDVVHCDALQLADAALDLPGMMLRVIAPHNVESLLMRRMADTARSPLRRVLYAREAGHLERWERAQLQRFDVCATVSGEESGFYSSLGVETVTIPNGVAAHPPPPERCRLECGEGLRLLFVGSGDHEPNRVGLRWFVTDVLPRLELAVQPRLTVVGGHWEWLTHPQCDVVGRVPLVGPYYDRHHAAVVPLLSGGGSRLKVAEALAKGIPLVGTSFGLEGYRLQPGVHALIGDDREALVSEITRLDELLRTRVDEVQRMVTAGYAHVRGFFWAEIGRRLVETYQAALPRKGEVDHGDSAPTLAAAQTLPSQPLLG
jgi:polysaccharide biosynthesis protein PslH